MIKIDKNNNLNKSVYVSSISHWKKKVPRINLTPTQIILLGFAFAIIIGGLLLELPVASNDNKSPRLLDCMFTSTSAVCVTGLVVKDTMTQWSLFGQIVIICLIQIGGLGFVATATIVYLLFKKKITYRDRLIISESLNTDKTGGVVTLTKRIVKTTFVIEGIGAVILSFQFVPEFGLGNGIYKSIFHSISSFCNAGFDLMGKFRSITSYVDNPLVNITISLLIIIGGLGFIVWFDIFNYFKNRKQRKRVRLHTKIVLVFSIGLIVVGTVVIFFLEYKNPHTIGNLDFKGKVLAAYFQSVTPRTAGYNTVPINDLCESTKVFTILLMFIGASPGSTGGGVKTVTLAVLIFTVAGIVRGQQDTEIFKRRIPKNTIFKALSILFIALCLIIFVSMVMSKIEADNYISGMGRHVMFLDCIFESTSAFATVGLTTGITPFLHAFSKMLLIISMFIGRVGPITFAMGLAYQQNKTAVSIKYPEEDILVG